MNPKQRILTLRLAQRIRKNPAYAKAIGIEIKNEKSNTTKEKK